MNRNILADTHSSKHFWVVDGTTLKNLHELLQALETMDERTFSHHVNKNKNDFHNWVKDVHKDRKLAKLLSTVVDRKSAAAVVKNRIGEVQKLVVQPKVPFPAASLQPTSTRKYELLVVMAAVVMILSLIGLGSEAVQITGAAVGSQSEEIQFLGFGGIFAVVVLLFVVLHTIAKKPKKEQ